MSETSLSLIQFDKYFQVLSAGVPGLKGAGICDTAGRMLSCSQAWPESLIGTHLDPSLFRDRAKSRKGTALCVDFSRDGFMLLKVELNSRVGDAIGSVVIAIEKHAYSCPDQIDGGIADVLDAVSECAEKEYQLTAELEAMAKELAGRYEELNLVYETQDDVTQYENDWEALSQLVRNCVDYLDVGMAALLFDGNNETFCLPNPREPIHETDAFWKKLYRELHTWIYSTGESVVINDLSDPQRARLCADVPYKVLACPVLGGAGDPVAVLVCANHIQRTDFLNSDRKLLEAMARKASKIIQANYDALTGLVKAHGFEKAIEDLLVTVREQAVPHCMLHIDLDQLQVINDTRGRDAGDAVIKQTAALLQQNIRTTDVVGYLGQGKYGVLLDRCPVDRGMKVAEHLRKAIETAAFVWEGQTTQVTVSTGMAAVEADTISVEAVLEAAEIACDSAKEAGRNRTQIYRQSDGELIARKQQMQMVNRIQTALREDRFEIYCQTIQPTQPSSERYHFEILLRMLDEQGEVVTPNLFIPAAERYHLMPVIDRWVIEKTCETLAQHGMASVASEGTVSINLSGQSFADESIIAYITEQLRRNGLDTTCLCLEITETTAMSNAKTAHRIIAQLKAKGCRFSLDDFGTGMSSFAYLKTLPVDYVKIDGSFVRQINEDEVSRAMVTSINEIGHVMQLQTIAEFVETDEIARSLKSMRLDYLQGYGIARPLPIEEYIAFLKSARSACAG